MKEKYPLSFTSLPTMLSLGNFLNAFYSENIEKVEMEFRNKNMSNTEKLFISEIINIDFNLQMLETICL